jgi:hypothetical protein
MIPFIKLNLDRSFVLAFSLGMNLVGTLVEAPFFGPG